MQAGKSGHAAVADAGFPCHGRKDGKPATLNTKHEKINRSPPERSRADRAGS
jgi:hypothetical protein